MSNEVEFTSKQLERIDEVCNLTIEYLEKLLDMEITDEIREKLNDAYVWCDIADYAADKLLKLDLHVHFPTRVCDDEENEYIVDHYGLELKEQYEKQKVCAYAGA